MQTELTRIWYEIKSLQAGLLLTHEVWAHLYGLRTYTHSVSGRGDLVIQLGTVLNQPSSVVKLIRIFLA